MVVMLDGIDLDTLYQHHQLKMCIRMTLVQRLHSLLREHQKQVMTTIVVTVHMEEVITSTYTCQITAPVRTRRPK